MRALCRLLLVLGLVAASAIAVTAVADDTSSGTGDVIRVVLDAHPVHSAEAATPTFGTVNTATEGETPQRHDHTAHDPHAPTAELVPDQVHAQAQASAYTRVTLPVPAYLEDDPVQPLFAFDAAGAREAGAVNSSASAFATLVLRLQRRVTSVGMWQPTPLSPGRSRPPPAEPPLVSTSTLNLLVAASYSQRPARAQGDAVETEEGGTEALLDGRIVERGLHWSVLPGPSFARGSMAAHAEHFGPAATGFEPALFSMTDRRVAQRSPSITAASDELMRSFDEMISFAPDEHDLAPKPAMAATESSSAEEVQGKSLPAAAAARTPTPTTTSARLPGFGPIPLVRTVSDQSGENRVVYVSGVHEQGRLHAGVALYSLLVSAWTDSALARMQTEAHAAALDSAASAGLPPPPPLSLNALGLRMRVTSEFAVKPFVSGVAAMRPRSAPKPSTEDSHPFGSGGYMSIEGAHRDLLSDDADAPPRRYARIVDAHLFQKAKLLFLAVAYDDGFLRVLSRNASLRAEVDTRNGTILHLAMSNMGSSAHVTPASGGGAREAAGPLNGLNNGNQLLAFVTPTGMGTLGLARIQNQVEQYCAWSGEGSGSASAVDEGEEGEYGSSVAPIRSGYDISAVAFDSNVPTVLYLALHSRRSIVLLHSRLGWNARDHASNFDDHGLRKPCPATGCPCRQLVEVALPSFLARPASAVRGSSSSSRLVAGAGAFFRPQYTLLPLRGMLVVGHAQGSSSDASPGSADVLAVFNATGVKDLLTQRWRARINGGSGDTTKPVEEEDDLNMEGLEFLFERALAPSIKDAARSSIVMDRLVGDRIELLVAGAVSFSSLSGRNDAVVSTPLHLFQLHLAPPPSLSPSFSFSGGGLLAFLFTATGSSRMPLFVLGVVGMVAWQWYRKRVQRLRAARGGAGGEGDEGGIGMTPEEAAMERAFVESRRRNRRRNAGAAGHGGSEDPRAALSGDALASSSAAALRHAGVSGAGGDSSFDEQAFMSDFLQWQRGRDPKSRPTSSPPHTQAAYAAELSVERERLREGIRARRSAGHVPDPLALARAAARRSTASAASAKERLEELRRERAQMRRKFDAMERADHTGNIAAHGLGIGGFQAFSQPMASPRRSAAPVSRHAPAPVTRSSFDRASPADANAEDGEDFAGGDLDAADEGEQGEEELEYDVDAEHGDYIDEQGEFEGEDDEETAFAIAQAQGADSEQQQQKRQQRRVPGGYTSNINATSIIDAVNAEHDDEPTWSSAQDEPSAAGDNGVRATFPIDAPHPDDEDEEPTFAHEDEAAAYLQPLDPQQQEHWGAHDEDPLQQQPWQHEQHGDENDDAGQDGAEYDQEAFAYGEDVDDDGYEDGAEDEAAAEEDAFPNPDNDEHDDAHAEHEQPDSAFASQEDEEAADALETTTRALQAAQLD